MAYFNLLVLTFFLLFDGGNSLLRSFSSKVRHFQNSHLASSALEIGEFENVQFTVEESVSSTIKKYKVVSTIKPKDTNLYLNEYKEEIKRRGVVFPGTSLQLAIS